MSPFGAARSKRTKCLVAAALSAAACAQIVSLRGALLLDSGIPAPSSDAPFAADVPAEQHRGRIEVRQGPGITLRQAAAAPPPPGGGRSELATLQQQRRPSRALRQQGQQAKNHRDDGGVPLAGDSDSDGSNPVASMLNNYPNRAVEREIHKHDRWVVDSLAYLNGFDADRAERYAKLSQQAQAGIALVVLTINRSIPYLSVLVSMLLRGHSPSVFAERLNVHIINIERRPGKSRYVVFDDVRARLGSFVTFHDWTDPYPQHSHIADAKELYLSDQKLDYIRALGLCKQIGSKWCVVMEDDAVPCVDFATKFDTYVNRDKFYEVGGSRPIVLDDLTAAGRGGLLSKQVGVARVVRGPSGDNPNRAQRVPVGRVGMVKLYFPYNDGHMGGGNDIMRDEYARGAYERDRAVDRFEANSTGVHVEKEVTYKTMYSTFPGGAVAEAYPAAVLDRLINYLNRTVGEARPSRVSVQHTKTRPVDVCISADFMKHAKLERLHMSPSLVNHIGFMSEHQRDAGLFHRISTDVRFRLD